MHVLLDSEGKNIPLLLVDNLCVYEKTKTKKQTVWKMSQSVKMGGEIGEKEDRFHYAGAANTAGTSRASLAARVSPQAPHFSERTYKITALNRIFSGSAMRISQNTPTVKVMIHLYDGSTSKLIA
mmetsp:Transcript_39915/g.45557  ORF Transcript_39915/g.45557 Transcript_39915/m.45557 type:complete len:125 (-) Transcript_39915:261-635(-)